VKEVAPYAGTISVIIDGRTITMGLIASSKIWVYDPQDIVLPPAAAKRKPARPRAAAPSRATARSATS